MKFSNIHTHTVFCDGRDTPEEMLARAEEIGFVSLGFSGHAPQNTNNFLGTRDEQAYIAAIRELQQKGGSPVRVHLGVEMDPVATFDRPKYDYILGAVHYFGKDEFIYPVDGKRERVQQGIDHLYSGDGVAASVDFFKSVADMCERIKPDIVAHYELLCKNNEDGKMIDIDDPLFRKAAIETLEAVKACGAMLEVNTGAIARGFRLTPYPYPFVLRRWKEMGGKVILGSDCHNRVWLNHSFDLAVELIRETGFTSICRLGGFGEERFVEEEL